MIDRTSQCSSNRSKRKRLHVLPLRITKVRNQYYSSATRLQAFNFGENRLQTVSSVNRYTAIIHWDVCIDTQQYTAIARNVASSPRSNVLTEFRFFHTHQHPSRRE